MQNLNIDKRNIAICEPFNIIHIEDILMPNSAQSYKKLAAEKMCDMADAYLIPASPHTCGGPLLYAASAHLCTAIQNFSYMESNYWKYTHQFPHFVKNVPVPVDGYITAPEGPGLGVEIREELFRNGDAIVETVATI